MHNNWNHQDSKPNAGSPVGAPSRILRVYQLERTAGSQPKPSLRTLGIHVPRGPDRYSDDPETPTSG
jgi:hypothetical protein